MSLRPAIVAALVLALIPGTTEACMWDRDTLAMEAHGHHDLLNVIAGRFPRNPPIYYSTRLARVEKEIAADPDNLSLYDDAAVACDRLHRSAEAITWMEKKAKVLAANPDNEHQYRYHANLGTFLIHQWLADGADPAQPEGEQGAEHIRKAIAINPDAHFGREALQLIAIEWILSERGDAPPEEDSEVNLLGIHGYPGEEFPNDLTPAKAIKGLSGMVSLGAAWESVDIFNAIFQALNAKGDASIAYLANLRATELLDAGKTSLSPRFTEIPAYLGRVANTDPLDKWYAQARSAADQWQQSRTRFIEQQIRTGKHPDTHPNFWDMFQENKHALPALSNKPGLLKRTSTWILLILFGTPIAIYIFLKFKESRQNHQSATA